GPGVSWMSSRAADLEPRPPAPVEEDERVDADSALLLAALQPHRVDRRVRAQRLGGLALRGGQLARAAERHDLDVVVAALADLAGDLGRALAGERRQRAGVVRPQALPRAPPEQLLEILATALQRRQAIGDTGVVAGVRHLEHLQPEDREPGGARRVRGLAAGGFGLHTLYYTRPRTTLPTM